MPQRQILRGSKVRKESTISTQLREEWREGVTILISKQLLDNRVNVKKKINLSFKNF